MTIQQVNSGAFVDDGRVTLSCSQCGDEEECSSLYPTNRDDIDVINMAVVDHGWGIMEGELLCPECADARTCRVCGCSDVRACPGGCTWVAADLCSACVEKEVGR